MLPYLINLGDNITKEVFLEAEGMTQGGRYGNLSKPTSIWHKGATYVMGFTGLEDNNSPVIIKYKGNVVTYAKVAQSTVQDPGQHAFPAILIIADFIYVFQVNGHGEPMRVFKSNTAESIEDGFTLISTIGDFFGYCLPRLLPDGRVFILTRNTGSSPRYSQKMAISTPNNYTSWTVKNLADSGWGTNLVRHYPSTPFYYGVNQWNYLAIQHRYDQTPETYFAQSIYKTQDFITFYSLDGNFSKNIDANGVLTQTEIYDNLTIIGSGASRSTYVGGVNIIVINDVIYGNYFNQGTKTIHFYKITNGVLTETPTPFDFNNTPGGMSITQLFHFYNGQNLIHMATETRGDINIYSSDLNFNNIEFQLSIKQPNEEDPINEPVIPFNINEIEGEYIIGGTGNLITSANGKFPYIVIENKFYL